MVNQLHSCGVFSSHRPLNGCIKGARGLECIEYLLCQAGMFNLSLRRPWTGLRRVKSEETPHPFVVERV